MKVASSIDNFENNIIPITIKYVKNCENFRIGYGHVDGGKETKRKLPNKPLASLL